MSRRFAPRNDMQKLAACAHGKDVMPGKFVTPHEFALSTAVLLCPAARRADCPVASLLAIITCFHTTINENVIYWRYGRSLMSYPRSGRRILQPFQFGKEDQLRSEKTTKSRLAAPNICYGLSIIQTKKPGPVPGQFPVPFFGRSLPYFHNNDSHKLAACSHYKDALPGKFATACAFTQQHPLIPANVYPSFACHRELRPCTREHLPAFCMSLRTSAHTGVAIRVPAEMPSKLAAVRANS